MTFGMQLKYTFRRLRDMPLAQNCGAKKLLAIKYQKNDIIRN